MRIDSAGNQVAEAEDMIEMNAGARACRCGRWRLAILAGLLICSGCLLAEGHCYCAKTET
jgi:hypothetical protein